MALLVIGSVLLGNGIWSLMLGLAYNLASSSHFYNPKKTARINIFLSMGGVGVSILGSLIIVIYFL